MKNLPIIRLLKRFREAVNQNKKNLNLNNIYYVNFKIKMETKIICKKRQNMKKNIHSFIFLMKIIENISKIN